MYIYTQNTEKDQKNRMEKEREEGSPMATSDHGRKFPPVLIPQETTQRIEDYVFKIERLTIFTLILFPKSTSLCVAFLYLSNMFYMYCQLFAAKGFIISSLFRDCKFWLERIAMLLVAVQFLHPEFNYWYLAIAYLGLSNTLYFAQQKKFSRKFLLPGSSFYGPNPTPGRSYYFWFRVAVFLLASLAFGTVLNSAIRNFLYILVVSFAVPEVLVNTIKPENLLDELVYDTPETLSTRILKSKDPEYLFWIERGAAVLLLIAYDIDGTASTWYLAASLFAVTNTIYFTNSFEFFLDNMINPYAPENVVKAEVKDECPSKEASEAEVVKDESPLKEQSESEVEKHKSSSKEASKEEAKSDEPKDESPLKEEASKEDARAEVREEPTSSIQSSEAEARNISEQQKKAQQNMNPKGVTIWPVTQLPFRQQPIQLRQQTKQQQEQLRVQRFQAPLETRNFLLPEYYNTTTNTQTLILQHERALRADEIEALREEKTEWEAEKKDLTAELEDNKRLKAKLESEKTLLVENIDALKRHRDAIEGNLEKLRAEVWQLKLVSEHDQAVIFVLEQRSKEWVEEKRQLEAKIEELTRRRRSLESEKAKLKEKLENSESRFEYYVSVADDFARKSEEWDQEKKHLSSELCEATDQCELYKSLLRDGDYGTPKFPSV